MVKMVLMIQSFLQIDVLLTHLTYMTSVCSIYSGILLHHNICELSNSDAQVLEHV